MNETEAKTKWCPMIHLPDSEIKVAKVHDVTCIASTCMMWRWLGEKTGFCGLAGEVGSAKPTW
jgi:hypothetical protein